MAGSPIIAPDDVLFLANVKHDLHRHDEALSYLRQLVGLKPAFDPMDRALFGLICKAAVDAIRTELKVFNAAITHQQAADFSARVDRIAEFRDRSRARLAALCTEVIDTAKTQLLPNAVDFSGQVFFQKLIGDMYRYLAENSISEDAGANAERAYADGMDIAERNAMSIFDPVKLGLTLNFAVFVQRHAGDARRAAELVKGALDAVRNSRMRMTPEQSNEVLPVIQAMRENLESWNVSEDESAEE
jgi:14-3-3 protein epsilon